MNKIEQFKNELIKRVQERDQNAYVTISQDMVQAMAGEYTATIHLTGGKKEWYAFNPTNKQWVVIYNV